VSRSARAVPVQGERSAAREAPREGLPGYLAWSRDPAVALLAVVPLFLLYELLRASLAPHERNGAEAIVTDSLRLLGPNATLVLELLLGLAVMAAAVSALHRRVPWGKVALVVALEGTVYGLMLGPTTQTLTLFLGERGLLLMPSWTTSDLVGSLGAGLFEEALFRLALLSLLAFCFTRVAETFGLYRAVGVVLAILVSAVAFSGFHHLGAGGEPFRFEVFTFRAVAGIVLGVLFVLRGFAVVVYAHAVYDLHFYLTR